MSSILTNKSAMVALQTLKSINSNLASTQAEISTGKSVASAKDNASVWAISKVMESDVKGFKGISDSLALGESTVAVARTAAETVTDLLTEIKGKVVAAQESNVDRDKIQTDIVALRDQIKSVVGAAQFNGLNLVQGTDDVNVLSSLDRKSDGTVAASDITVNRQDLSTSAGTYGSVGDLSGNGARSAATITNTNNTITLAIAAETDASDNAFTLDVGGTTISIASGEMAGSSTQNDVAALINAKLNAANIVGISSTVSGDTVTIASSRAFEDVAVSALKDGVGTGVTLSATSITERAENITFENSKVNDGDGYRLTVGSSTVTYVAGKNETMEDVARGLKTAVDALGNSNLSTTVAKDESTGKWQLRIDNDGSSSVALSTLAGTQKGTASGGLFGLDNIDVTTNAGADAALANVETLINNSIDAAAAFGSVQGRIETQSEFVSKLTDSLKAGIGAMVDADMEETSARLQALQVQQQLGVQSLSIANQSPQSILSLFR